MPARKGLEVYTNIGELAKLYPRVPATVLNKAAFRSMNKATDKTRTKAKSIVADMRNLSSKGAGKRFTGKRATASSLSTSITATGAPINWQDTKQGVSQRPGGVSAKLQATGRKKVYPRTFNQQMQAGGADLVFRRGRGAVYRPSERTGKKGLFPIIVQKLPGIGKTLIDPKVTAQVFKHYGGVFPLIFNSQLKFELDRDHRIAERKMKKVTGGALRGAVSMARV